MRTHTNLRFLLALGNTKIVVLKESQDMRVYCRHENPRRKTVAPERLTEALSLQ